MLQQQRRRAEANHRAPKPAAVLACTRATTQKCFYPQVLKRIYNLYPKILRYYSPQNYCIIYLKIPQYYTPQNTWVLFRPAPCLGSTMDNSQGWCLGHNYSYKSVPVANAFKKSLFPHSSVITSPGICFH